VFVFLYCLCLEFVLYTLHVTKHLINLLFLLLLLFHMDINHTNVVGPTVVAEDFAKHFQSVYNNTTLAGPYSGSLPSDFLHLLPINELDILRAINTLDLQSVSDPTVYLVLSQRLLHNIRTAA
jgi:hypothetical protein